MNLNIHSTSFRGLLLHFMLALTLCVGAGFLLFYEVLPDITYQDNVVTVPDLKGMSIEDATAFLKKNNLLCEVTDSSYDAEHNLLAVLTQFPKAQEKVKAGRKILLTLNGRVPPKVIYPDFRNASFDFAQTRLQELGLRIGTLEYRPDMAHNIVLESSVNGTVIDAGDQLTAGTAIHLVLGKDVNTFALPSLTDMPFDEAEGYILGMKLTLHQVHSLTDPGQGANIVARQIPMAGDTVHHGDNVELWIYNLKNQNP